ncbi:putative urea ABC transporter substrate-binding protein, partial [Escherichia coli]
FANPAATAVVTWNPQLTEVAKLPGAAKVFDSSQVPAELLDLLAVDTATLKANPNLGMALAGIWYETIQLMQKKDAAGAAARAAM